MATNDKTGPDDEVVEGSWSPRRTKGSSSKAGKKAETPDPDALVEDIEKTREELAETLDAIADKVSPKRVTERTKKKVKDGTAQAVDGVKDAAGNAADAVKEGVAAVKDKVGDDSSDADRSPLAPATSVEVDAVSPLPGAEIPHEPAPTPGALADAAYTPVAPAGSETTPIYTSTLPPAQPSRMPIVAGAGALLVLLMVLRRRRRR